MMEISKRIASLSPEKREVLLRRLEEKKTEEARVASTLPRVVPDGENRFQPFPLTDIQQVYWTGRSGLFDLGACGTNVYMELEFSDVDSGFLSRLSYVLQRLIQQHDMLRAAMMPNGKQQVLASVPPYEMEVVDLSSYDSQTVTIELEKNRKRMHSEQGEIYRWPLFEFVAFKLDNDRIRWQARIDALLVDGSSRILLLRKLLQLLKNPDIALPPLECTYRDYALTWAAFQESELCRQSRSYWLNRISELPPPPQLPLTTDVGPQTPSRFINRIVKLLEPKDWNRLKTRGAKAGLTPTALAITAFAEALKKWSRERSFTLCIAGSYRPPIHPEINEVLGNFSTISLLQVDDGPDSFKDKAASIQNQLTAGLEHRYFSGFHVLREWNRIRGCNSSATMPVIFNSILEYSHKSYQYARGSGPNPEAAHRIIEASLYMPQVMLTPTVADADGFLGSKCQTVEALFPEGFVQELMEDYSLLLQRLANDDESWSGSKLTVAESSFDSRARSTPRPDAMLALGGQFIEPRDDLERELARIFGEVLNAPPVGVKDNFFDLGGNSFLVARLVAEVQNRFGSDISLKVFFQAPTVENVANLITHNLITT